MSSTTLCCETTATTNSTLHLLLDSYTCKEYTHSRLLVGHFQPRSLKLLSQLLHFRGRSFLSSAPAVQGERKEILHSFAGSLVDSCLTRQFLLQTLHDVTVFRILLHVFLDHVVGVRKSRVSLQQIRRYMYENARYTSICTSSSVSERSPCFLDFTCRDRVGRYPLICVLYCDRFANFPCSWPLFSRATA